MMAPNKTNMSCCLGIYIDLAEQEGNAFLLFIELIWFNVEALDLLCWLNGSYLCLKFVFVHVDVICDSICEPPYCYCDVLPYGFGPW